MKVCFSLCFYAWKYGAQTAPIIFIYRSIKPYDSPATREVEKYEITALQVFSYTK